MNGTNYVELTLFLALLAAFSLPLSHYLDDVYDARPTKLTQFFLPLEKLFYRFARLNPEEKQTWYTYAVHLLIFSLVTTLWTYFILRYQSSLPLNPQWFSDIEPDLAFNTAISFATNTDWQSYSGEKSLSYFSQILSLMLQNFFSAAVGLCAAVAVIRGLTRKEDKTLGNFWSDFVRSCLYVLLPLSFVLAIFLVSQGSIQNFSPYLKVTTLEGATQILPQGPVASQTAIKLIGTNGGGFFGANSAHPFENPTPLSNFVQIFSILLLPSALIFLLGRRSGNMAHAWSLWSAMGLLFAIAVIFCAQFETRGNPLMVAAGASTPENMEGKEVRFGIFDSALYAVTTTNASCGAVNAALDSFTPLGGLVPLNNMLLGEVIFGGTGSGFYGALMYIILTVFIAGLLVGRTPEYLGKKIEAREVKLVMLAVVVSSIAVLGLTAWAALDPRARASVLNPGAHGFSEILYAFASAANNNGSAFAGLKTDSPFWNYSLAAAMFAGRYLAMIPMLAVAGSLGHKGIHPGGEGSFPIQGPFFTLLLAGMILLVGALTFFPTLTLGPIVEHFNMVGL